MAKWATKKDMVSMAEPRPPPREGGTNRILVILLFAMLALNLYQQRQTLSLSSTTTTEGGGMHSTMSNNYYGYTINDDDSSPDDDEEEEDDEEEDEADSIVRKSYEASYARILPCTDDEFDTIPPDKANLRGKACMKKTLESLSNADNNPTTIADDSIEARPCLTMEECRDQGIKDGIAGFVVGTFPDAGCFSENDIAYWGEGYINDEEERVLAPLNPDSAKKRLWCHDNDDVTESNDSSSPLSSVPWWFRTLLRDIQTNGAYGFWHHFTTAGDPSFNFCTIGKVATTEWRRVFCKLNKEECEEDPDSCGKNGCAWRTKREMPEDAPRAVFLRDPLERLLSGFLDKCYRPKTRKMEGHCEPNAIFNADPNALDSKGRKLPPTLLDSLEMNDKEFFAAYIDVLPLKWNVHFVPQAIACDLHRTIDEYDFIGKMGEDFMSDLERMADQFGGRLPEVLNASFAYLDHVGTKNTGKEMNRHATRAPAKVKQFYTARTVRRGLELLSIDYVALGLEVPGWAREMLRDDAT